MLTAKYFLTMLRFKNRL